MSLLPLFLSGTVCSGFGRGSKQLGIPTANLPESEVEKIPASVQTGVYYGWAQVHGEVRKMVMSLGWNPFFKNVKKTAEVHILHKYDEDFYGEMLKVVVLGYIRNERDFASLDALIAEISNDIEIAKRELDRDENLRLRDHPFFHS